MGNDGVNASLLDEYRVWKDSAVAYCSNQSPFKIFNADKNIIVRIDEN